MGILINLAEDIAPLEITNQEIQDIIDNNLPDDLIGVENDLITLANTRNERLYPIYIKVLSLNPFKCIPLISSSKEI